MSSTVDQTYIKKPGAVFATLHLIDSYFLPQYAIVLHYTKMEWLARDKHTSALSPFVSYKENKVL
jgi:hypothetical protein